MTSATVDPAAWEGIYLAEDIATLRQGIASGSWIEAGLGTVGASLDMLSATLDPLGALAAWGAAWLMEHVRPLREALDRLAGSPAAITEYAQTWRAVGGTVQGAGQQLTSAVERDLAGWTGAGSDAYHRRAAMQCGVLSAASTASTAIGVAVEAAGMLVATVRTIVRNLIAEFVATLTVRLATWAAEELFSAGLATPFVVAQVSAMVGQWGTRITSYVQKLVTSLRTLGGLIDRLGQLIARIPDLVRNLSGRSSGPGRSVFPEGYIGPDRQLAAPPPPTGRERLTALRSRQAQDARLGAIRQGVQRVDREVADGTHSRPLSKEDLAWLNEDPRRKEIAYDPDIGTYRVEEARLATAAEKTGVLTGPVQRSVEPGRDLLDGNGVSWSAKSAGRGETVESMAGLVSGEALRGSPTLVDLSSMSMREQAGVRTLVLDKLAGQAHPEVWFYPRSVAGIPAGGQ